MIFTMTWPKVVSTASSVCSAPREDQEGAAAVFVLFGSRTNPGTEDHEAAASAASSGDVGICDADSPVFGCASWSGGDRAQCQEEGKIMDWVARPTRTDKYVDLNSHLLTLRLAPRPSC